MGCVCGGGVFVKVCEQNNEKEPRLERMKSLCRKLCLGLADLDPLKLTISKMQISSLRKERRKAAGHSFWAASFFSSQKETMIATHHMDFMATTASCGEAVMGCCYLPCVCDQVLTQGVYTSFVIRPGSLRSLLVAVFMKESWSVY